MAFCPKTSLYTITSLLLLSHQSPVSAEMTEDVIRRLLNKPAEIRRDGQTVYFAGFLTAKSVESLLSELRAGRTRTLRVTSGGGEVPASITAAEYIRDNGLDIVVEGLCASSCANYLFTAAASRRILPGGVVAWHGGADQKDFREFRDCRTEVSSFSGKRVTWSSETYKYDKANAGRERQFFASVGVSSYITRAGQEPDFSGQNYTYSVEDMEKFGLRHVTAEAGYGTAEFCHRIAKETPKLRLLCLPVSSRMLAYERARLTLGEECASDGTLVLRRGRP